MDSSLRLSAASGRPIPVAADVSPQDKREKTKRFQSFFNVHEHPPSSLFKDFKRHFRATIAYGPGFIKIQSKTKADQMALLRTSDLKKPDFRANSGLVYLRNNDPKGAWKWIEIKPETPSMVPTLLAELEAVSWRAGRVATGDPTTAAATSPAAAAATAAANSVVAAQIPAVPAAAVATRAATAAVAAAIRVTTETEQNNTTNDGFIMPLASPLPVSTANNESTTDNDCQLIDGMKMRILLNKENPSENSVIAPSIVSHRPMRTVKRENVDSSTERAPTQQMDAERDEQLQTKESESQVEEATGAESPIDVDGLVEEQEQQQPMQQQLQNVLGQFNNSFDAPASALVDVNTEASFMTPAHDSGVQQLHPTIQLDAMIKRMQQQQQQNSNGLAMGGLNSTQNTTDLNASYCTANGSGDAHRGALMPLSDELIEYKMIASEFQQLLDRIYGLPEGKRALTIGTVKSVVNLALGGFM